MIWRLSFTSLWRPKLWRVLRTVVTVVALTGVLLPPSVFAAPPAESAPVAQQGDQRKDNGDPDSDDSLGIPPPSNPTGPDETTGAQLLIKTGPAEGDDDFEPGDIVHAYNEKRVLTVQAQNIINPKNFGFNEHGLREPGSLLDIYLQNSQEYKFERVGTDSVRRTSLESGQVDLISDQPNEEGEYMDVLQYLQRRLRSDKHQIFGTPGQEYWYGGRDILTDEKLDAIWDAIEDQTAYRRDHASVPLTPAEQQDYELLSVVDFSDEQAARLTENIVEPAGLASSQDRVRRRYRVNLATMQNSEQEDRVEVARIVEEKPEPSLFAGADPHDRRAVGVRAALAFMRDKTRSLIKLGTVSLRRLLHSSSASAAGTITTSIGTRTAENVDISSVAGAGPYTVTLASAPSNTDVGDTLTDEAATPNSYLITAISGADLTVADLLGAATAPSASGDSQATTTRTYSTITLWEADLDNTDLYDSGDAAVGE